jgi:ElaB/YqjD/DUF883 family membrane-anchored ribosome-binding protein
MDMNPPNAAEAMRDARDQLARNLRTLVDEAETLLKSAQGAGNEKFTAARDKFETQLSAARYELEKLQDDALHQARRAARATDHAVHEHPYTAMGITAGIGLLLGLLIARR